MENRSHAIMAGLFVILLMVAAVVTVIWLGKKNIEYEPFELISQQPVGGLSVQSQVRFQGMPVGQVQGLEIDQQDPGSIRIRIGVIPETPVTKSTWAEITTQGVTGISNIDLRDDGSQTVRLHSTEDHLVRIPVRPGFLQRFQNTGAGMVTDIEVMLKRLQSVLSHENVEAFGAVLENTKVASESLKRSVVRLEPVFEQLPGLVSDFQGSLKTVDAAGREMALLVKDTRSALETMTRPGGALSQAGTSLSQLQKMVAQIQSSTLPEIERTLADLGLASSAFTRSIRQLERSPQSLLFGPAPVQPGPGEAGFEGFSH